MQIESLKTFGYVPKGEHNPKEKSDGISIRKFSEIFIHFNFPIKRGEYYYIICKVNDIIARVRIKFNRNKIEEIKDFIKDGKIV